MRAGRGDSEPEGKAVAGERSEQSGTQDESSWEKPVPSAAWKGMLGSMVLGAANHTGVLGFKIHISF